MRFSLLIVLFSKFTNILSESKYIGNVPGACLLNPILDRVRAHLILDGGGKKAPRVNSAI